MEHLREVERQVAILRRRAIDLVSETELRAKLAASLREGRPLRVKLGADPSAPDIHLGHVVALNKLREFQDLGHTVVFIIGDFTGMIGDPSGRSQTRKPLTREQVEINAQSYREQVFHVLDPDRTEVRFNSEWCAPLKFEDLLRLSSHVTVAQLLARDDFAKRYAATQPISLVEFMYPLAQAWDSVQVRADVELGGTDQLFNLLLGRELQKAFGQEPQIVLTLPLLEGLDGVQKMSKSLGNTISLTEPPREMFGKVMSVSDELMWRYFELVLALPPDEVATLREAVRSGARHPREVKDELGRRIVARFAGEEAARAASEEFARVFSGNALPDEISDVEIGPDDKLLAAWMEKAGLAPSRSEARRLIKAGAVRLDEERISDPQAAPTPRDGAILRVGKRGFARIRVASLSD
ncbi:MAG: tyrosine--tRNA ligase [Kiritimatiellia bacterium]|nr:tyrosine--tRNA ligase [Kiritimatiellia bacterium]